MGACASKESVGLKDKNAVKPKAQIRQTSASFVVNSNNNANGTIANSIKARQLNGKVKTYCVIHENV